MTYQQQDWEDEPAKTTPVSAGRLTHIEAGLGGVGAAVAGHLAADDPHPGYLTDTEGDGRYAGTAHTHDADDLTALPPHAASHATAGADPVSPGGIGAATPGEVAAAVSAHAAATDPHPVYLTVAEADARYARSRGVYPLSAYGFHSASDQVTVFGTPSPLSGLFGCRILVPAGVPIVEAATIVNAAGVVGAGGLNGFAVYSDDPQLQLLGATPDDDTVWTADGWRRATLTAPIDPEPVERYVFGLLNAAGFTTAPGILYAVVDPSSGVGMSGGVDAAHLRSFFAPALSSWPASIDRGSVTRTSFLPLMALAGDSGS